MAEQRSTHGTGRGKAVRFGVPVAVAGLAALTIGLAPALASDSDPALPPVSAEELLATIAASDTERLTGTVEYRADLGLPRLSGLGDSAQRGGEHRGGGPFGSRQDVEGQGAADQEAGDEAASADPRRKMGELTSGSHLLRVAVDGPTKQRVSVLEEAAEYSVIRNGDRIWAYDSAANSAYRMRAGAHSGPNQRHAAPGGLADLTPQRAARQALEGVRDHTRVTVDGTVDIAGRDAYELLIVPKDSHSTIGSIRIAVDADRGVPLKYTLTPRSGGPAAVEIGFRTVDFGAPDPDSFTFTPPKDAKVTERDERAERGTGGLDQLPGVRVLGGDWDTVARIELPGGVPLAGTGQQDGADARASMIQELLGRFTTEVSGDFGTGRVLRTRCVNALIVEQGVVYVGAVTPRGLVEAAERATR